MDNVLQQVISGTSLPYEQIDVWIRDAKFHEIEQFATALAQVWDDRPMEQWRYSGVYDRLVMGLALNSGENYLETLLTILKHRAEDDRLMRRIAAQLATTQAPEVLDKFVATPANLWEYLLHELVIEGVTIATYKNLSQLAETTQANNHPLSALPLHLLSAEAEIGDWRKQYTSSSTSHGHPGTTSQRQFGLPDSPSPITFDETTTPALQTRLASAFENWTTASNGRIEARQFTAQSSLSPNMITGTRLLLDLGLDCLKVAALSDITLWKAPSTEIINVLFSAAANGGAYSHGLGNAYGRLHVWKSIAALLNEPDSTPIPTLNEAMNHTQWLQLHARSSWFYDVAWDNGIIALSADQHTLTILAATDTD